MAVKTANLLRKRGDFMTKETGLSVNVRGKGEGVYVGFECDYLIINEFETFLYKGVTRVCTIEHKNLGSLGARGLAEREVC